MAVTAQEIADALGVTTQALQGALAYAGLSSRRARINAELEILQQQRANALAEYDAEIAAKREELAEADEELRQGIGGGGG